MRSGTRVAERATEAAGRTAREAGVEIRVLDGMPELREATDAFRLIWGYAEGQTPVEAGLLRAISFAGGYVAGAFADGSLVGASAGFLGDRGGGTHLHSHITGVVPTWQGRHVGLALKQHQRAWAIDRRIAAVEWTFDPLVRRNAYFNLVRLGADVDGFEASFYGDMHDAVNAGDETDRAVVRWTLESTPAVAAAAGEVLDRDEPAGRVVLHPDQAGRPVTVAPDGDVLRAWVPEDVVALRRRDAALARDWRMALRDTFGAAVASGYAARSMSRDGWYTLVRASI